MTTWRVRPVIAADADDWTRMREALWPDDTRAEHRRAVDRFFAGHRHEPREVLVALDERGAPAGFAELSIRNIVDGCETERVGYLEGWYVEPDARRRGVGRALVRAAEEWALAEACTEFGSDTTIDNTVSLEAHRSLGFEETGRVCTFRKTLAAPAVTMCRPAAGSFTEADERAIQGRGQCAADAQRLAVRRGQMIRPEVGETAPYYFTYIDQVGDGDIRDLLERQAGEALDFFERITEDQSTFRYAPDKWSVRDVLGHVNDCERLFAFRALWFARAFDSPLPSFDQNTAVASAGADRRAWRSLVDEFRAVRAATIAMFHAMPDEAWARHGVASGNPFTVRALAYIAVGHVEHHSKILRERYLTRV